jgi:6-pyruvoyltetrahydropterin/6-carboxytetrahydropterin synthase
MLVLSKRIQFSAAHRLHNPALSAEENRRVFGECNHPHGHGHNYEVEVMVEGQPDPATGMVMNLRDLREILEREVLARTHYKSLDAPDGLLAGRLSTTENLAMAIWDSVAPHLKSARLYLVRVRESENNVVEYTGPERP